ncbi:MAG: hypothetical protein JSW23_02540 [Planctomycetota bacterium]|nr:MAG: hypothetical protein JSW23_02540 [Planctomycetota bacterium]
MGKAILYLGDTALNEAGSNLAGVMTHHNISFDYLPSDRKFPDALLENKYQAVIISDYPADNFSARQIKTIVEQAAAGTGLLMIGGWESFTGDGGKYADTELSSVLPVIMQSEDDRVNWFAPCLAEKIKEHEILGSLPFEQNTPDIGGFNRLKSKPDSDTILLARRFKASYVNGAFTVTPLPDPDPLLVVGSYEKGRVCAFATDAAPHWVGGLVDWGPSRVKAQGPGANPIEVGNWYAAFLANMINWTARKL